MKSVKDNLIVGLLISALGITALAASKVWANPLFFIQITNTAGLAFGSFAAGTGGTVTVSPAGVRTKAAWCLSPPARAQPPVSTSGVSHSPRTTLYCDGCVPMKSNRVESSKASNSQKPRKE